MKASLLVLALFVWEEDKKVPNFKGNMVKNHNQKTNPVLFAPSVNHHSVTFSTMESSFIESGYSGNGGNLNVRQIDVITFTSIKKNTQAGGLRNMRHLTSMYPVLYKTNDQKHVYSREIIEHSNLVCAGIPNGLHAKYEENFGATGSIDFIQKLFFQLQNVTVKGVGDLIEVAKKLHLGDLSLDSESFVDSFRIVKKSCKKKI